MTSENIKIIKGAALVYRAYDVGWEIALSEAEKCLSGEGSRFRLATDTRKAIIIREAPLALSLGEEKIKIGIVNNISRWRICRIIKEF